MLGVGCEERSIADQIDQSWYAGRRVKYFGDRLVVEAHLPASAGDVHPMVDVAVGLLLIEIGQPTADRNTLVELRHPRRADLVEKLRLPYENDLDQLFLIGLE